MIAQTDGMLKLTEKINWFKIIILAVVESIALSRFWIIIFDNTVYLEKKFEYFYFVLIYFALPLILIILWFLFIATLLSRRSFCLTKETLLYKREYFLFSNKKRVKINTHFIITAYNFKNKVFIGFRVPDKNKFSKLCIFHARNRLFAKIIVVSIKEILCIELDSHS